MKKTMALILSLLLVLSSLYLPGVAFAEETQEDVRDTVYYQEALSLFLDGVKDRKEHIEYEYTITDLDVAVEATDLVDDIIEALRYDIFTQRTEQPVYGDYLYHSIIKKAFSVKIVEAAPGTYVIKITGDFSYFTTKEQEDLIAAFAEAFQQNYITESMTEYQITKTIYDFLTRYIDYDNDLFEDSKTGNQLYPKDSQRYIN